MNINQDIGSRGRGRGWQQSDNPPKELRRPKTVPDETKGLFNTSEHRSNFLLTLVKTYEVTSIPAR